MRPTGAGRRSDSAPIGHGRPQLGNIRPPGQPQNNQTGERGRQQQDERDRPSDRRRNQHDGHDLRDGQAEEPQNDLFGQVHRLFSGLQSLLARRAGSFKVVSGTISPGMTGVSPLDQIGRVPT